MKLKHKSWNWKKYYITETNIESGGFTISFGEFGNKVTNRNDDNFEMIGNKDGEGDNEVIVEDQVPNKVEHPQVWQTNYQDIE